MLALSDLVRKDTLLVYHLPREADYFEQSPDIETYYDIVILRTEGWSRHFGAPLRLVNGRK